MISLKLLRAGVNIYGMGLVYCLGCHLALWLHSPGHVQARVTLIFSASPKSGQLQHLIGQLAWLWRGFLVIPEQRRLV